MTLVDGPVFAAVQQCGEDYNPVHFDLGLLCDAVPIPDILLESAKGGSRLV